MENQTPMILEFVECVECVECVEMCITPIISDGGMSLPSTGGKKTYVHGGAGYISNSYRHQIYRRTKGTHSTNQDLIVCAHALSSLTFMAGSIAKIHHDRYIGHMYPGTFISEGPRAALVGL